MPSERLRKVYQSARWKSLRNQLIENVGRCQWKEQDISGRWIQCPMIDKRFGGTESLTVDHTNIHANPYDPRFLRVLCRKHHGIKDGGKRIR